MTAAPRIPSQFLPRSTATTAYRWNILLLLAASQAIAYIDRVNFAVAGPYLIRLCRGHIFRRQQSRPHAWHSARIAVAGEVWLGVRVYCHRRAGIRLGAVVDRDLSRGSGTGPRRRG